jgi:hypothetical protein
MIGVGCAIFGPVAVVQGPWLAGAAMLFAAPLCVWSALLKYRWGNWP